MRCVILFEDNPSAPSDIRQKHMPDHLAFLEANGEAVHAAGPLISEDGTAAGGLWMLDVDTLDDAEKLVKEDPFWPTGLRQSVKVLEWKQVFAHGKRLIS